MIYEADGEWVVNDKSFTFVDDQGRCFAPGQPCKAKLQGWVKIQVDAEVLKLTDSPETPAEPVVLTAPEVVVTPPEAPPVKPTKVAVPKA